MFNKKEIMKKAWMIRKAYKLATTRDMGMSSALTQAWEDVKRVALSDELSLNDCYKLSWSDVSDYLSSLKKRTKTFWNIAKLVYEKGKFSTHRKEFNALYHAVPKM